MIKKIKSLTESSAFSKFSLIMIVAASVLIGAETFDGIPANLKDLMVRADQWILGWFVLELGLKILACGRRPFDFFRSGWNLFDFFIVAVSVSPAASPAFAAFRLLRVLRVLRLVSNVPDLQILTGALLKSLPSMGYVGILLFLIVYVYAVLGTHLFKATDPEHFGHLGLSLLSLFQVITLEGWAEIFRPQLKIYGWPAALYFISFILMGTMILLNLLIGVVLRSMEQVQKEVDKGHASSGVAKNLSDEELSELLEDLEQQCRKLRSAIDARKSS